MIQHYRRLAIIGLALFLLACRTISARAATDSAPRIESQVSVPRIFSDNMVLQQGTNTAIWGWADDGALVSVIFRNEVISTRAKDGKWMVRFHNLAPGDADTLTITSANTLQFKNVLVGEVWLAGGQSNMEFPLRDSFLGASDIASAANPMIHIIKVPHTRLDSPTNDINASWSEASPETVANFSAVAYYFARDLQERLHVPVGIIESDWGGTPAEAWIDYDYLNNNRDWHSEIIKQWDLDRGRYDRRLVAFEAEKQKAKENNTELTAKAPGRPWAPSELYNGMIAPLVPYGIRGVIWYQGESNAGSLERAWQYHTLFPGLIVDWRSQWGQGNFPFLLVQLAPYMDIQKEPGESAWASLREAQMDSTQILPNVGMAVITDVGMEHNIHPVMKRPVGERLAVAAYDIAYHQPIEGYAPAYKSMKVEDLHITVKFDHVGGGLLTHGDELTGFAIAGEDQKFHWAVAHIEGKDKVVVFSPEVQHPVAVRFGWANYPVVNLWSEDGLPASPFRTDDFEK